MNAHLTLLGDKTKTPLKTVPLMAQYLKKSVPKKHTACIKLCKIRTTTLQEKGCKHEGCPFPLEQHKSLADSLDGR